MAILLPNQTVIAERSPGSRLRGAGKSRDLELIFPAEP
jgi:hypothetical protein